MQPLEGDWNDARNVVVVAYACGHCGNHTASDKGLTHSHRNVGLRICTYCKRPTFFDIDESRMPGPLIGESVEHLSADLTKLYDEVRRASTVSAYTLMALGCRKILMHVAVDLGAKEGDTFKAYVNFIYDNHHVPANAKDWVEKIREMGNQPNHELFTTSESGAKQLLDFVSMLLKLVYEYPKRAKP